jgi:glucosamine--fructose-6-phosphate aminotransferase (isomerizing)
VSRYASEIARQPETLAAVLGRNDRCLLEARTALRAASRVRLAALGSSRHAAGYGAAAFDVLSGVTAHVLDAPGATVPVGAHRPDDALVVVSQSGRTPSLVALAQDARAAGATVLAVVNDESGELIYDADVVLRCHAGNEDVIAATGSVTAQMLLLRALAADLRADALDDLVVAVGDIVAAVDDIEQSAWTMRVVPQRVVAGGLAGEWVAEEIALKLAEVAGVLATAESVVDFLHGPVAVDVATLALLDPADPNAATIAAMTSTVSAGPSPTYSHPLPFVADATLAPIARVVAGQVAALAVASLVGADPDDARGLQKVTMTS